MQTRVALGTILVFAAMHPVYSQSVGQKKNAMNETSSAYSAAAFVSRLDALVERLAKLNVVVSKLECYWGSFGSWRLEAQDGTAADRYAEALKAHKLDAVGPEVVRFSWDGRDQILTIDVSPTRPRSAPNDWTRKLDQEFKGSDEAMLFLEKYLAQKSR